MLRLRCPECGITRAVEQPSGKSKLNRPGSKRCEDLKAFADFLSAVAPLRGIPYASSRARSWFGVSRATVSRRVAAIQDSPALRKRIACGSPGGAVVAHALQYYGKRHVRRPPSLVLEQDLDDHERGVLAEEAQALWLTAAKAREVAAAATGRPIPLLFAPVGPVRRPVHVPTNYPIYDFDDLERLVLHILGQVADFGLIASVPDQLPAFSREALNWAIPGLSFEDPSISGEEPEEVRQADKVAGNVLRPMTLDLPWITSMLTKQIMQVRKAAIPPGDPLTYLVEICKGRIEVSVSTRYRIVGWAARPSENAHCIARSIPLRLEKISEDYWRPFSGRGPEDRIELPIAMEPGRKSSLALPLPKGWETAFREDPHWTIDGRLLSLPFEAPANREPRMGKWLMPIG
jgi:sarcosine oxidase delta subunit